MQVHRRNLRLIAFGTLGLLVLVLIVATGMEQLYGAEFVHRYIYASPWAIALWGITAVAAAGCIVWTHGKIGMATLSIHSAFIIILVGALTSHVSSLQGHLHLRVGDAPSHTFTSDGGSQSVLPFGVSLESFSLDYYTGTSAPMDFVSSLHLTDGQSGVVSMNNVFSHAGYRFYQSSYDSDMLGSTLLVSYDPWGIGLTYAGYALLFISIVLFMFQKKSGWRRYLAKAASLRTMMVVMGFVLIPTAVMAKAENMPQTVPLSVANEMEGIYIYYNSRVCPFETFARDFTTKVYGKSSYMGLTATQVVAGWLFFYDDWKARPFIKIKSGEIRRLLGVDSGKYASLTQFVGASGYKLDGAESGISAKALAEANEKFSLVSTVATGAALHIYPIAQGKQIEWFSPADKLPASTPEEQWIFIRKSLNLLAQYTYEGNTAEAVNMLKSTRRYQQKMVGAHGLPDDAHFYAERVYNRLPDAKLTGVVVLLSGIACYVLLLCVLVGKHSMRRGIGLMLCLAVVVALLLTFEIALRWYVSGHLPLSNGFETMQFMAWCSVVLTLFSGSRWRAVVLSAGLTVCGFALLVAGMGQSNPQITQLMPVLASPLLSVHVVMIMLSYSLLAVCMLNGVAAIIVSLLHGDSAEAVETLHVISRVMLTPALLLLAAGIFIGAIWANRSWGTYWSWDPKETWALITMMVYAFAIHPSSIPAFGRPMFFHIYVALAFISVLITYFGVNFFLGGMHSYAAA